MDIVAYLADLDLWRWRPLESRRNISSDWRKLVNVRGRDFTLGTL